MASKTFGDGTTRSYGPTVVMNLLDASKNVVSTKVVPPASASETQLTIQLPDGLAAGNWQLRVVKDYQGPQQTQSNRVELLVLPTVSIASAQLACSSDANVVTLAGAGFGLQPPAGAKLVGLKVGDQLCAIASWAQTQIVATCSNAVAGSTVVLAGAYNITSPVSAQLSGNGCGAAGPGPTPAAPPPVAVMKLTVGATTCDSSAACKTLDVAAGQPITFDAWPSQDASGNDLVKAEWGAWVGQTVYGSTEEPRFTYAFPAGVYVVGMRVTDAAGRISPAAFVVVTAK